MGEKEKRYTVSLAASPFSKGFHGRRLFTQIGTMEPVADDVVEGEVPTYSGRMVKVRAEKLLGPDADLFVTNLLHQDRLDLQKTYPLVSIEDDIQGQMARFQRAIRTESMAALPVKTTVNVQVSDENGVGIAGVSVQVVYDADGNGAVETTNDDGHAKVLVNPVHKHALYVAAVPPHTYWPNDLLDVTFSDHTLKLTCTSIAASPKDSIDRMLGATARRGKHVIVAIIDGGFGPHAGVKIRRESLLADKDPDDNGLGHGTHVAGIVSRLAPGAELRSYRVFEKDSDSVDASAVAMAIRKAVTDGAHIINLSITFPIDNSAVRIAIQLANHHGVLCVCAAGNSGGAVLYPARLPEAIAVAACGVREWPGNGLGYQLAAAGKNREDVFAASFTCRGPEVNCTAPGVGVVSTYPGDRRAVMSGTSMSTPTITNLLASALSDNPTVLAMDANGDRTEAIAKIAVAAAVLLGLPVELEGHGVPFLG